MCLIRALRRVICFSYPIELVLVVSMMKTKHSHLSLEFLTIVNEEKDSICIALQTGQEIHHEHPGYGAAILGKQQHHL